MNALNLYLKRNLRRDILRGHPWVYGQALKEKPKVQSAQLCKLFDSKKQFLAWGFYDPHGPLSVRILSTKNSKSFSQDQFFFKFQSALEIRKSFLTSETTGYRLFNGEGDQLPGLICDVYDNVAVIQYDGKGSQEFWGQVPVAKWLQESINCQVVFSKSRGQKPSVIAGEFSSPYEVEFLENGVKFVANLMKGQKTGFFLDQRENRNYLKGIAKNKDVLNLFSYTGGFSVYAGAGGARHVTSVDVAGGALDYADRSWKLNDLVQEKHESVTADVFEFLKQDQRTWDYIIVDPPSMASSEKNKEVAIKKYVDAFALATKKVRPGGSIFYSSCSSHISFNDFFDIIEETLSKARCTGRVLRVSGQGADHPFPHVLPEFRYLKFVHVQL